MLQIEPCVSFRLRIILSLPRTCQRVLFSRFFFVSLLKTDICQKGKCIRHHFTAPDVASNARHTIRTKKKMKKAHKIQDGYESCCRSHLYFIVTFFSLQSTRGVYTYVCVYVYSSFFNNNGKILCAYWMDSKIANIDYSILIFISHSFDKFKFTCKKWSISKYNAMNGIETHSQAGKKSVKSAIKKNCRKRKAKQWQRQDECEMVKNS